MKTKKLFSKLLILFVALFSVFSFSGCGISEQEAIDAIETYLNKKYNETHKVVVIEHVSTVTQFGVPFSNQSWYEAVVTKLNSNEFFTAECDDNGKITGDTYYQLLFEETFTKDLNNIFSKYNFMTVHHIAIEWQPSLKEWNSPDQYKECIKDTIPTIRVDISMEEENPLDKTEDFYDLLTELKNEGIDYSLSVSNYFNQKTEKTYISDSSDTIDEVRINMEFLVIDENSSYISTPDTAESSN